MIRIGTHNAYRQNENDYCFSNIKLYAADIDISETL